MKEHKTIPTMLWCAKTFTHVQPFFSSDGIITWFVCSLVAAVPFKDERVNVRDYRIYPYFPRTLLH